MLRIFNLFVIALFTCGVILAQNDASTIQTGNNNDAFVVQEGGNQKADISQTGNNNKADVDQYSYDGIVQTATAKQKGNKNSAEVDMDQKDGLLSPGLGNSAYIEQIGNNNASRQSIFGNNTRSDVYNYGNINQVETEQKGDYNYASVKTLGSMNEIFISQAGNKHYAMVRKGGPGLNNNSNITKVVQDGGDKSYLSIKMENDAQDNKANVRQIGSYHTFKGHYYGGPDNNYIDVDQVNGNNNWGKYVIHGESMGNMLILLQEGNNNSFSGKVDDGSYNDINVKQAGNDNTVGTAFNNGLPDGVWIEGNNNTVDIDQLSNGNHCEVDIYGLSNQSIVKQQ